MIVLLLVMIIVLWLLGPVGRAAAGLLLVAGVLWLLWGGPVHHEEPMPHARLTPNALSEPLPLSALAETPAPQDRQPHLQLEPTPRPRQH
jgi:hypothetical protein